MKAVGPDDETPEGFSYDQDEPRFRNFRAGDNLVAYTLEGNEIAIDWISGRGIASMLKSIVDVDGREVVKISGFVSDKLEQAREEVLHRFGKLWRSDLVVNGKHMSNVALSDVTWCLQGGSMTQTIQPPEGCQTWHRGDDTKYPPADVTFLEAILDADLLPFTGPIGLCGGRSETRSVIAIHRGRGRQWELVFREYDLDVITTMTTDLPKATSAVVAWLQGKALSVAPDSIRDAA